MKNEEGLTFCLRNIHYDNMKVLNTFTVGGCVKMLSYHSLDADEGFMVAVLSDTNIKI